MAQLFAFCAHGGVRCVILGDQRETENLYHERPEVVNRLTALLEKYKKEGHSRPL